MKILYVGPLELESMFWFLEKEDSKVTSLEHVVPAMELLKDGSQYDVAIIHNLITVGAILTEWEGIRIDPNHAFLALANFVTQLNIPVLMIVMDKHCAESRELARLDLPVFILPHHTVADFSHCVRKVVNREIVGRQIL